MKLANIIDNMKDSALSENVSLFEEDTLTPLR